MDKAEQDAKALKAQAKEAARDVSDKARRASEEASDALDEARSRGAELLDSARDKGADLAEAAREKGSEYVEAALERGSDYAHRARTEVDRLYREGSRRAGDAAQYAEDYYDDVSDLVRRKPAQALGIAAGVGFLIGLILASRR